MLSLVMSWEHETSEMRCVTIRKKITFNTYDYRNLLTLNAPNVAETVDYIRTSGDITNSVQTVAKLTQRVSMKWFTDKSNRYLRFDFVVLVIFVVIRKHSQVWNRNGEDWFNNIHNCQVKRFIKRHRRPDPSICSNTHVLSSNTDFPSNNSE